ncbi:DUF3306 domain-containing protein [Vibrio penaeicida]|uniref:DUF3306 domain-containing protein n=1 Tax=Vibrio penaeicida TaxID=104609 RepID=A0AAV5NKY2_9VIBR|nr:DUF3306 domain-containing protein [Vibrio penaeicida]RTZ23420.1 DUF3306 domain-containing protein [Vibrio penaeicida]GLQ70696.1 hypothetical protein GCM10007932_00560 [Vibrio penaeicida]
MASDFLKRWSQRKLQEDDKQQTLLTSEEYSLLDKEDEDIVDIADAEAIEETDVYENAGACESKTSTELPLEDEDPSDEPSVATLLSKGAETAVKKAALKKLFLSGKFSEVDALNDYDHDYSKVGNLTQEAAEKLRGWVKEQLDEETEEENKEIAKKDRELKENESTSSEELLPQSEALEANSGEPKIEENKPQAEEIEPSSGVNETKYTT